jgi:diadenosine tetraphosphatase ApaH/serine/threonine PP2A family protein phosphatase
MTKTAVITDLHANREAIEAVLEHARAQGIQRWAFLGDFVGYGADPGWVVDRIREMVSNGALAVVGNHDMAVVKGPTATMRDDARDAISWTRARLNEAQIDFLAELPLTQTVDDQLYVHANAHAPHLWGYIQGRLDAVRSLHATDARYIFCGHVHEPRLYHLSSTGKSGEFVPSPGLDIPVPPHRRWLVIPGSAGQPRDGNPAACYAVFDRAAMTLSYHRVPYDHERAAAKIRAADLPQRLAARLGDGL